MRCGSLERQRLIECHGFTFSLERGNARLAKRKEAHHTPRVALFAGQRQALLHQGNGAVIVTAMHRHVSQIREHEGNRPRISQLAHDSEALVTSRSTSSTAAMSMAGPSPISPCSGDLCVSGQPS